MLHTVNCEKLSFDTVGFKELHLKRAAIFQFVM